MYLLGVAKQLNKNDCSTTSQSQFLLQFHTEHGRNFLESNKSLDTIYLNEEKTMENFLIVRQPFRRTNNNNKCTCLLAANTVNTDPSSTPQPSEYSFSLCSNGLEQYIRIYKHSWRETTNITLCIWILNMFWIWRKGDREREKARRITKRANENKNHCVKTHTTRNISSHKAICDCGSVLLFLHLMCVLYLPINK